MKTKIFLAGLALVSALATTGCFKSPEPDVVITLSKEDMIGTWRVSSSPIPYFYITFTDKDNFYTYNSNYENQKGTFAFENDQLVFYIDDGGKTSREVFSYRFWDGVLTLYEGVSAVMSLRCEDESVFFGNWIEQGGSIYGFYPDGTALHFAPDSYDPSRMTVDDMYGYKIDELKRFVFKDEEYTMAYDGGATLTLTPLQGGTVLQFTRP